MSGIVWVPLANTAVVALGGWLGGRSWKLWLAVGHQAVQLPVLGMPWFTFYVCYGF